MTEERKRQLTNELWKAQLYNRIEPYLTVKEKEEIAIISLEERCILLEAFFIWFAS